MSSSLLSPLPSSSTSVSAGLHFFHSCFHPFLCHCIVLWSQSFNHFLQYSIHLHPFLSPHIFSLSLPFLSAFISLHHFLYPPLTLQHQTFVLAPVRVSFPPSPPFLLLSPLPSLWSAPSSRGSHLLLSAPIASVWFVFVAVREAHIILISRSFSSCLLVPESFLSFLIPLIGFNVFPEQTRTSAASFICARCACLTCSASS